MIEMGKKYRTRDGRSVRILCTDRDCVNFPVVGIIGGCDIQTFAPNGRLHGATANASIGDLIEVVPDVVKWYGVYDDASITDCEWSLADVKSAAREEGALPRSAILKVTVRNGEVIADVLPVDYAEPTP